MTTVRVNLRNPADYTKLLSAKDDHKFPSNKSIFALTKMNGKATEMVDFGKFIKKQNSTLIFEKGSIHVLEVLEKVINFFVKKENKKTRSRRSQIRQSRSRSIGSRSPTTGSRRSPRSTTGSRRSPRSRRVSPIIRPKLVPIPTIMDDFALLNNHSNGQSNDYAEMVETKDMAVETAQYLMEENDRLQQEKKLLKRDLSNCNNKVDECKRQLKDIPTEEESNNFVIKEEEKKLPSSTKPKQQQLKVLDKYKEISPSKIDKSLQRMLDEIEGGRRNAAASRGRRP
jgi:hypothetical protein